MMKNCIVLLLALALVSCGNSRVRTKSDALKLTDDVCLPTTPVKNQGNSSLCWACAMLATIETEHIVRGDSVNLSILYPVRNYLAEQANEIFFTRLPRSVSSRGMGSVLIHLIENYGETHYDAYHQRSEQVSIPTVERKVSALSSSSIPRADFQRQLSSILDDALGETTPQVHFLGATYTPVEFAHSVCLPGEYEGLTSFTHHPFGTRFVLEVPDNYYHDSFRNVPLGNLMSTIEKTLRSGHPVCWEGDISEPGFDEYAGVAETDGSHVTQELRQRLFENHKTTDDHCMELIGIAHDSDGRLYFKAKNSWGETGRYKGFMYLSYDYVALKTIAVWIPKE